MDDRLRRHSPSPAARRRAEAEGLDLDAMKRTAPHEYMMLNAGEALRASPELVDLAGSLVLAAFPEREVFRAPGEGRVRLLVFPPLAASELERLDRLLATLVDRPEWCRRHAFFRQVADVHGRMRELAVPVAPGTYRDGDAVVGPFASREEAAAWARRNVDAPRVHDVLRVAGAWLCDVFRADEA